jgi:ABC-type glycerol-3-phosphate transport system permease component
MIESGKQFSKKAMIYAILLIAAAIQVAPFVWMILSSFKTRLEAFAFPPIWIPKTLTTEGYRFIAEYFPLFRFAANSVIITAAVVILNLIFCSIVAYPLARHRFPGRDLIFWTILATMMVPFHLILIPMFIIVTRLHLVNTYLGAILPYAMSAFNIFLFVQYFKTIPLELSKAARIDGCSELGILFRIIWPLSKPVLITVGILTFIQTWNLFLWPLIVLQKQSMRTLPLALATLKGVHGMQWNALMAQATIISVPVVLLFTFLQKYIVAGLAQTGLKG